MYPPLHDPEKNFIPYDWFESYIDTYLERDVRDLINPGNLSTFRKFIQVRVRSKGTAQDTNMLITNSATPVSNTTLLNKNADSAKMFHRGVDKQIGIS